MSQGLIHRTDIQRDSATGTDAYNQPTKPDYSGAAAYSDVQCRVWIRDRNEILDGGKVQPIQEVKALFYLGQDIIESDRLSQVEDRQGNVLVAGPLIVKTVVRRRRHQEVTLEHYGA